MNLTVSDVKPYAGTLKKLMEKSRWCETVVCVPFLMIPAALKAFKGSRIAVGAQNVSEAPSGARTGEISALQLKEAGVKYVIVGHSERREFYGETDAVVNKKLKAVLEHGMTPIVCVGETLDQRDMNIHLDTVRRQVKSALYGLGREQARQVVIAYEPIWAIGTGRTATDEQAGEMCREIRAVVRGLYDARVARAVTVQYGGSMKPANAAGLLAQPDIDGGLIGGASLEPEQFYKIVEAANQ